MSGYAYAAICLGLFGWWGLAAKMASDSAGWRLAYGLAVLPAIVVAAALIAVSARGLTWTSARWPLVTGIAGSAGTLFFYLALERAPASRVIPLTAVYPAITVVLSWVLLGERLTARQMIGVALALAGVVLLA